MVLAYFLFFSFLTVRRHQALQSTAFDLGIYNQALWNTTHGDFLRSTNEPGFDTLLADHSQPTLLLFALLYLIHAGPTTLLIGQTAILALGALPAYGLAVHTLTLSPSAHRSDSSATRLAAAWERELIGLVFAAVYLLTPALEQANLFDFHPMTLAASFLLFAFYFLRVGRPRLFLLFVALTIGCKEVLPLVGILFGLYVFLVARKRRLSVVTFALSALWLYAGLFIIIPHFNARGQSQYFALHYGQWGNTPLEMMRSFVTRPGDLLAALREPPKPAYLWTLLAPWVALPLIGLPVLLLGLPVFAVNLLSATRLMHDPDLLLHYAAPLVPILFVATIDGIAWVSNRAVRWGLPRRWAVTALTTIVLLSTLVSHRAGGETPLAADFRWPQVTPHQQAAEALFAKISPDAVLSASDRLNPHVSGRRTIYLFPRLEDANAVLFDATPTNVPLITRDEYDFVQSLINEQGFGIVDGRDGVLLLHKGAVSRTIPKTFFTFVRASGATPQVRAQVHFGESLLLTGFDVVQVRPSAPRLYLRLYLRPLRAPLEKLRLFTFLTDDQGRPVPGSEYELPGAIWYPPSRWAAGETVRLETLHWELYLHPRFGVALVVTRGDNPWDVGQRLRAEIESAPSAFALRQGGTLLELIRVQRVGRRAEWARSAK
jgi:uncharacterized membrane protein